MRTTITRYWRGVVIGAGAGLVWTAAKVSIPDLIGHAIDKGVVHPQGHTLLTYALVIAAVGIVQGGCTGLRRYYAFWVAYRVETDLRHRLFAHIQRLHLAFHDHAQTGQLMSRSATDLQQAQGFVSMIPITISSAVTVVAVAAIMLATNVKLTFLALCALPLINLVAKTFSSRVYPVSLGLQQELAGVATVVEETVTGIRAVKGFGAEAIQARVLRQRTDRVWHRAMAAARIRATYAPLLDVLPAVGMVLVLWYGGHQVLSRHLSVGQLTEFVLYVTLLVNPLRMLGQLVAQAQRAIASADRVGEILSTEPEITSSPKAPKLPPGGGALRFDDVRFAYQPGAEPVLDGFSLAVEPGESVALVGPTGSGKTTVARLIPRFYDIQHGTITIDGADIRKVRLPDLRRNVGIVFEDTFLFTDSIRANIAFAEPDAPFDQVVRAARSAGADEFIRAMPEGYDTIIGERGFSLSGGQRQRIALARAIVADPRVLILDDATSSVDPTKEHEIRGALLEVMRGRSTIVIAHRPATIALADRVILLDGGRVVAQGTHEELLETSERYREVLARAEGSHNVAAGLSGDAG